MSTNVATRTTVGSVVIFAGTIQVVTLIVLEAPGLSLATAFLRAMWGEIKRDPSAINEMALRPNRD